jgi:hypothetical protein
MNCVNRLSESLGNSLSSPLAHPSGRGPIKAPPKKMKITWLKGKTKKNKGETNNRKLNEVRIKGGAQK